MSTITSSRTNLAGIQNCLQQQTRKLNTEMDTLLKMQCTQSAYPSMSRQARRRTEHHSDRVHQENALQADLVRAEQMGERIQNVLEHLRRDFNKLKHHLNTYTFSVADADADACQGSSAIDTRSAWKSELCCMIKVVRNFVNLQYLGSFRLLNNIPLGCENDGPGTGCDGCYRPTFKYVTPTGDALCMSSSTQVSNPDMEIECLYKQLCLDNIAGSDVVTEYWYNAMVAVVKGALGSDCSGFITTNYRDAARTALKAYLGGTTDAADQARLLTDLPANITVDSLATPGTAVIVSYGNADTDLSSETYRLFTFVESIWHQNQMTVVVVSGTDERNILGTGIGASYDLVTAPHTDTNKHPKMSSFVDAFASATGQVGDAVADPSLFTLLSYVYGWQWTGLFVTSGQPEPSYAALANYAAGALFANPDGIVGTADTFVELRGGEADVSPVSAILSDDCNDTNFQFVRQQIVTKMEEIRKAQITNDEELKTIRSVREVSECNKSFHENAFGGLTQINEGELCKRYEVGKELLRDIDNMYRENCVTKQTFFKDVTLNGCL